MKKNRINIDLSLLHTNTGQLPWLPKNPRQWTKKDVENTAKSIKEDPDFLEDRPLLVVPFIDAPGQTPEVPDYVVFGGNLRREGSEAAKKDSAPCMAYYPETEEDFETIKRRAMKDNGSFGSWDWDTLANEWDDLPLADWGIPVWKTDGNNGSDGSETGQKSKKEPKSSSRTANKNDVPKNASFRVVVEFDNSDEQNAFLSEMEERGLPAHIMTDYGG